MTVVVKTLIAPPDPVGIGGISATTIIDRAAILLQDVANDRWTRTELLGWLNEAQRQIAMMQPVATSKVTVMPLIAGSRQTIPADGWLLLDVLRNMGANGATPGRVIRVVSRKLLDAQDGNWHAMKSTDAVQNYVFNPQDSNEVFYVFPPSTGMNRVELSYSRMPVALTDETKFIDVHAIYQNALVDYIVYRAASKDAEHAPMKELAAMYLDSFRTSVMGKAASEGASDVNQLMKGLA